MEAASRRQRPEAWPEILTKAEAARYLRCSPRTVQQLTSEGRLTPYRLGKRPRYPLAMLRRFVEQESGGSAVAS